MIEIQQLIKLIKSEGNNEILFILTVNQRGLGSSPFFLHSL